MDQVLEAEEIYFAVLKRFEYLNALILSNWKYLIIIVVFIYLSGRERELPPAGTYPKGSLEPQV